MADMVRAGEVDAATDMTMDAIVRNQMSRSRASIMELVKPAVSAALADADVSDIVTDAALDAVADVLAAEDVVLGPDGRALPTGAHGSTYWGPLPRSTGYLWGVVVSTSSGDYVALGVKLNGDIGGRVAGGGEVVDDTNVRWRVRDAVQEWWIGPIWQRQYGWYSTVGIGDQGQILAIDIDDRTPPVAVQVGTAGVDDHNVPSRFTIPGRGSVMQWTHHNGTSNLFVSVARGSGRAEGFRGSPVQSISIGEPVSYGQWFHREDLQTSTTDTFLVLVRNHPRWAFVEVLVDWSAGTATRVGSLMPFVAFAGQPYIWHADGGTNSAGNPVVRLALGYNPAADMHEVFLMELDIVTGVAFDVANPTVTHNIRSGTYLSDSSLTPVLPGTGAGTRRLLGIRDRDAGESWGILTTEYAAAVAPSGVYTEHVYTPGVGLGESRTFGTAGAHLAQYPAGAQYAPDGTVWHSNESGGVWTLSHEGGAVHRSTKALMRPMPTGVGPVAAFVSEVGRYVNYQDWGDTDLLALEEVNA